MLFDIISLRMLLLQIMFLSDKHSTIANSNKNKKLY